MVRCVMVGRQQDAEPIVEALQSAGLVHVAKIALNAGDAAELTAGATASPGAAEVRAIDARLAKRFEALRSVAPAPARLQSSELSYLEVGVEIDKLLRRRAQLQGELEQLEAQRELLAPWGEFDVDDVRVLEAAQVRVVFVEMSEDEWLRLDRSIPHALASVREGVRNVVLFDPPTDVAGTVIGVPRTSLRDVKRQLESAHAGLREVQRELGRFAHYASLVAERRKALSDRLAVLNALDCAVSTGPLFALEGFVPRDQVVDLQESLSPFACALQLEDAAARDERAPVKLRNNSLVAGFESVVEAFSGMRYGEKDFTWAVGLLFVGFGSLCLLDAGYGLMLAIVGIALRLRGDKRLGNVFALTGIISVAVGLLCGQFFGLIVGQTVMPDARPLLTLSSEPYHAFLFSLFVGMAAMLFSYSMAIWQRGLRSDATGALLVVLAAFVAVYANMATEFVHSFFSSQALSPAEIAAARLWGNRTAWAFGCAAVSSWVAFPGRVFGDARVGNVLWTLYSGTTGFVQDVLSHMRLFGIALSGGIMALVVNEVAGRFSLPITALFAVVGHTFVFLLSLLSMYIHTSRLIFLEWGSKCIDGGSNFYSPLRRSSA